MPKRYSTLVHCEYNDTKHNYVYITLLFSYEIDNKCHQISEKSPSVLGKSNR